MSSQTAPGRTARPSRTSTPVFPTVSTAITNPCLSFLSPLRTMPAVANGRTGTGIHCDSKGNVYAGTNDGVHVWNTSGKLLGKIYTGIVAANFQFAGEGRMVIMGKTKLFYATLAASGVALQ